MLVSGIANTATSLSGVDITMNNVMYGNAVWFLSLSRGIGSHIFLLI